MTVARVLHVLGVVLWIGGVAFVTTVLLPGVRQFRQPAERFLFFETIERRFARQARIITLVTGLSGLYLVHGWNLWPRFLDLRYWWMHAMVAIWAVFTLTLFVLEPLFMHRLTAAAAQRDPEGTFARMTRLHWIMLVLSLAVVAAAVAGSHGYLFGG